MRIGHFIRFNRRFEDGFIRGYVLDVGPRFFLLSLVSTAFGSMASSVFGFPM
jgi:hypothetical protein